MGRFCGAKFYCQHALTDSILEHSDYRKESRGLLNSVTYTISLLSIPIAASNTVQHGIIFRLTTTLTTKAVYFLTFSQQKITENTAYSM